MRRLVVLLMALPVAAVVMLLPAGIAAAATAAEATVAEATVAAPSGQDRAFLRAAHQTNLVEILAGELALRKSGSDEVRRHARLFVDEHRRLDTEVRALAKRLAISLPGAPTPAQQEQVTELSALSGTAFDTAWLSRQIAIHQQSRFAGRRQLAVGSDSQVKALARRAGPVIQAHLSILEETAGRRTPDAVEGGAGGQSGGEPVRSAPLGLGLVGVAVVLAAGALLVLAHRRRA